MCIFGVLCVLEMPAFAAQSVTPAPPTTLIKIENSLRTNDYKSALELSHAALATYPNDCRLWTLRGMAYAGAHRPKLADAAYRHALELVPNYLPALEGAAQLEYESGGKNAEDLLQRILVLRPADPTANVMLGMTQYKRGACKEAVPHFEQAKSLVNERLLPLSEYGICLSKLGSGDDAVRVCNRLPGTMS